MSMSHIGELLNATHTFKIYFDLSTETNYLVHVGDVELAKEGPRKNRLGRIGLSKYLNLFGKKAKQNAKYKNV
jgi:hypothetical protein